MVRGGKAVRSRTDYILGTYCSLFWNVAVRDPHHNSDHYMVMGLWCGLDGHVPEETAVSPQDVVRPGPYCLPPSHHGPRPPFSSPLPLPRKEVRHHVLKPRLRYLRRYLRPSPVALHVSQISVEVPHHYECGASWLIAQGRDNPLYRPSVVGGEVTSNDVPSPPDGHHLEATCW